MATRVKKADAATPVKKGRCRQTSSPLTPYSTFSQHSLPEDQYHQDQVLHTPRRGRRMAGVQMGWHSPQDSTSISGKDNTDWAHVTTAPNTLPRASKKVYQDNDWTRTLASASTSVQVTPRKRRAAPTHPDSNSHSTPSRRQASSVAHRGPSLIDQGGFASASLAQLSSSSASPAISHGHGHEQLQFPHSPAFQPPPPAQAKYHRLAAFKDESDQVPQQSARSCNLVAVEVKGMGRVAVDRAMAVRLGAYSEEELKASQAAANQSSHSPSHGSNETLSASSLASSSTCPTSLDTPAYSNYSNCTGGIDPSPSFSLASHFPASEQGSPSTRSAHHNHQRQLTQGKAIAGLEPAVYQRVQLFKDKLLSRKSQQAGESANTSKDALLLAADLPRLGGSESIVETLPTLQWPDNVEGPWNSAIDHIKSQEQMRFQTVSRWLDTDSYDQAGQGQDNRWASSDNDGDDDDDDQPALARARRLQHPMVSKVLRDRRRREAELASSRSLPNLRQSSRPGGEDMLTPRRHRSRRGAGKSSANTRRRQAVGAHTPKRGKSRRSGAPITPASALSHSSSTSAGSLIGCHCGTQEEGHMVQCDGCHLWHHLRCVGIRDPEKELQDTWFCQPCEGHGSVLYSHHGVSPASTAILDHQAAPSTAGSMTTTTPSLLSTHGGIPAFPRTYAAHIGVGTPSAPYLRNRVNSQDQSQPHLPVFAQVESPMYKSARPSTGLAFSSALALAPSPQMDAGTETMANAMRRQAGQGRARASRIGWQSSEPGSPLDRKSQAVSFNVPPTSSSARSPRFRTPSYLHKHQLSNARSQNNSEEEDGGPAGGRASPNLFSSLRNGRFSNATSIGPSSSRARDRTPSPTRAQHTLFSTPSRHARSGRNSMVDENELRDADDVFSTPSRHLPGSSWWGGKNPAAMSSHANTPSRSGSIHGGMAAPSTPSGHGGSSSVHGHAGVLGSHTPSRSGRNRESSGWGLGLATPGSGRDRDMLFGGQHPGSDMSGGGYSTGGMPSLVFSSGGGIDAVLDDFPAAHWGSASPSRIASARRRQRSGVDPLHVTGSGHTSSSSAGNGARMLGSRTSTSSIRSSGAASHTRRRTQSGLGQHKALESEDDDNLGLETENEQDGAPSSSPFPRTPSMDLSNHRMIGMRSVMSGSTPRGRDGGSPTATASRIGNNDSASLIKKPANRNHPNAGSSVDSSNDWPHHQHHQAQHTAPGFGLGLDLDDVLDYF
ncbi:unnamed protein product [Sympodiomycopsis kandeliae]